MLKSDVFRVQRCLEQYIGSAGDENERQEEMKVRLERDSSERLCAKKAFEVVAV